MAGREASLVPHGRKASWSETGIPTTDTVSQVGTWSLAPSKQPMNKVGCRGSRVTEASGDDKCPSTGHLSASHGGTEVSEYNAREGPAQDLLGLHSPRPSFCLFRVLAV